MSQVRTNDANNANTNREVSFDVEPVGGEQLADTFLALQGPATAYPYYGKIQNPTAAQQLAQLRLSLVTRVLSRWAILVGVRVREDTSSNANGAIRLTYEQDEMGVFFNNNWPLNPTGVPKHSEEGTPGVAPAGEISDTVGIGGMNAPKSKPGLIDLCADLDSVTYDGGASFVFNTFAGNITLPDGTVATGSAALTGSTMVVAYVDPTA